MPSGEILVALNRTIETIFWSACIFSALPAATVEPYRQAFRQNTGRYMDNDSAMAVLDLEPTAANFLTDVQQGLRQKKKRLPCKYFYDKRGSQLFERICELEEYYPTRTELAIMREHSAEIATQIGPGVALVEYGSGSSIKTRWLLDHLSSPVAYVPVDISRAALRGAANRIAAAYPGIDVLPVCADFTQPFHLPVFPRKPTHAAVYFPGSTIGNFEPAIARSLLAVISDLCGAGGGLVIGFDLQKEHEVIEAAYDDNQGVTAEFNLNLLRRINNDLSADFDLDAFDHRAFYDAEQGRVDISLVSRCDQEVDVRGEVFDFACGEAIHTEYSHKYTVDQFSEMASQVGLRMRKVWTDAKRWFAVGHFVVD